MHVVFVCVHISLAPCRRCPCAARSLDDDPWLLDLLMAPFCRLHRHPLEGLRLEVLLEVDRQVRIRLHFLLFVAL